MVDAMTGRTFLLVSILLLVSAQALAERTSEVYRPRHRLAEELLSIAQTALGEEGSAVVDPGRNALVLIGSQQAVAVALTLLERQDRALEIVRIRYRALDLRQLARVGLEIAWEGEVGVGLGRVSRADASVEGRLLRTKATQDFAGEVRVESGQEGWVGTGRAVPVSSRDHRGAYVAGVAQAQRGFTARPRVLGDGRIRLEIASRDSRVDDAGRVDFAGTTTTVVASAGETIAIGDLAQASRSQHASGRSWSTRKSSEKRVFLLTLEIESP
ncbi:MAG: hypothetical protein GY944_31030 [bacterium]|nr:hypothetical protein [bacterium]